MNAVSIKTDLCIELKYRELSLDAKYLYYVLLCNKNCTQTGIYEISPYVLCEYSGFTLPKVTDCLAELVNEGMIVYDAPLIYIRYLRDLQNWAGYNYRHIQAFKVKRKYAGLMNRAYEAWEKDVPFDVHDLDGKSAKALDRGENNVRKSKPTPPDEDSDTLPQFDDEDAEQTDAPVTPPSPPTNSLLTGTTSSPNGAYGTRNGTDKPDRSPLKREKGEGRREEGREIGIGGAGERVFHGDDAVSAEPPTTGGSDE